MSWFGSFFLWILCFFFFFFTMLQIGFLVFSLSFNREKRSLFLMCESNYFHLWKKLFIRKFDSMIPIRTISNFREEPHRHFQDVLIRIIFSILCFFFLFFTVLLCFFFFFFTVLQIGVFSSFNSEKRFLFLTCESNYFRKHLWKKLFIRKFNDRDNFQFPLIWRNNISKLYTFSRIRPVADASRESLTTSEANGKKKKEREERGSPLSR